MTASEPMSDPPSHPPARIVTADLISGTILVSVFIAAADDAGVRLAVLGTTAVSMLIIWLSQVFVVVIALEGRASGASPQLGRTIRTGLRRSNGLLIAAVPPLLILALGAIGIIDGAVAYWTALWTGAIVLAVLGWIAFSQRSRRWLVRAGGAMATAGFGLVIIWLRILIS